MKSMILVLSPKECCDLMNGDLSILVRKKFPVDHADWVYVYCTKSLPLLLKNKDSDKIFINKLKAVEKDNLDRFPHIQKFNGKVVARFWCDKVEEIYNCMETERHETYSSYFSKYNLQEESCLTDNEITNYLQSKDGCAIHITKLEIFDKPKEISEFWNNGKKVKGHNGTYQYSKLTHAPTNYCYVED